MSPAGFGMDGWRRPAAHVRIAAHHTGAKPCRSKNWTAVDLS